MNRAEKTTAAGALREILTGFATSGRQAAALLFCLCLAAPIFTTPAFAVEPDEVLDDPALESRARDLSAEIRCLVCQNESIDSSNAPLARDLRIIVRERLVDGDSDQEILDYLVARYGDFVLLRPPMKPETYFLWFGPVVLLLLGTLAVGAYFVNQKRRADNDTPVPLSAEEKQRLAALLEDPPEQESPQQEPGNPDPQKLAGGPSESPKT